MPHLKVTPFDSTVVKEKIAQSKVMTLQAKSLTSNDEIIGIEHGGEEFYFSLNLMPKPRYLSMTK